MHIHVPQYEKVCRVQEPQLYHYRLMNYLPFSDLGDFFENGIHFSPLWAYIASLCVALVIF